MVDVARVVPGPVRSVMKRTLGRIGLEVSRDPYLPRLLGYLRAAGITTVVDIGANEGQYARKLFDAGYRGSLLSVEPLQAPYMVLAGHAAKRPQWTSECTAVSEAEGEVVLNVAGNSQSSSVLTMLDLHVSAAPRSGYVSTELVPATTIDALYADHAIDPAASLLKIDVQGYESVVLDGAVGTLAKVAMVELELSLAPLYDGQALMPQIVDRMAEHGLVLWSVRPAFADSRNGRLLQLDGVFARIATDFTGSA